MIQNSGLICPAQGVRYFLSILSPGILPSGTRVKMGVRQTHNSNQATMSPIDRLFEDIYGFKPAKLGTA